MRTYFFIGILHFVFVSFAQNSGNTLVFKVRAKETSCDIICEQDFFWLESDNQIKIKLIAAHNVKTKIEVTNGTIVSQKNDIAYVRFTKPGTAVISVYQITRYGKELLATKGLDIKSPIVYFCDIKLDSTSKYIRMDGGKMFAYSDFYKKKMSIVSYDMYFIEDTTKKSRIKTPPICMQSQQDSLSETMRKVILNFQPQFNSIYFNNIICKSPDGIKRFLPPIQLDIAVDTANKQKLSLVYSIRKKVL